MASRWHSCGSAIWAVTTHLKLIEIGACYSSAGTQNAGARNSGLAFLGSKRWWRLVRAVIRSSKHRRYKPAWFAIGAGLEHANPLVINRKIVLLGQRLHGGPLSLFTIR